jgi:hypothetical protein
MLSAIQGPTERSTTAPPMWPIPGEAWRKTGALSWFSFKGNEEGATAQAYMGSFMLDDCHD